MLYIVDYHVHSDTFYILDTDDNTVQSITKNDFIEYYDKICHLIPNRFYSSCFGENYDKVMCKRTKFVGCFELYDRNDLNKKPALRVLFDKLNISSYSSLLMSAHAYNCMYENKTSNRKEIYSMSFCTEIMNADVFNSWIPYFKDIVYFLDANNIKASSNNTLNRLAFYYIRDYILWNDTQTQLYYREPLLGHTYVTNLDECDDGYLLHFSYDMYAKLYFFALSLGTIVSSICIKDIIKKLSLPLYSSFDSLGSLYVDSYSNCTVKLCSKVHKPMYWITKNYVLRR